ncbi:MAG: UvrD-helicase domain-containing protein, partial [Gammaproteobacteria bacterium]
KIILKSIKNDDELRELLHTVRQLPKAQYDKTQWEALAALREVLRHLVAELQIVFGERNTVDFVEVAMGARSALGQVDNPSELLLALDQRIQHVLIDEFQDTSYSQHYLLELLTAGWEPDDGRTLFLVGDPMQSIYRFRGADPALFLKVKHRAVGNVALESLELTQNFRSAPGIVDWVNRAFRDIFPAKDDLTAGMGRFHSSLAVRKIRAGHGVKVHPLRGSDPRHELDRVMEILGSELNKNEQCSVGILVQSRSHLFGLHEQLRSQGFNVHAVEIDAPNQTQIAQDLIGLTRALTHLGDRIAWLGILRAPWCGLSWQDLHALCVSKNKETIWQLMGDQGQLEKLSDDGQQRLAQTRRVLELAFGSRNDQSLARWVERTWVSLGGPACLDFLDELNQSDRFFALLDGFSFNGDLNDPAELDSLCSEPWGQGEPPRQTGIEVMTIHRAKGLEFDTVILLGLGRKPRPPDAKALYWMERIGIDERHGLLMAPLTGIPKTEDPLTEWVRQEERARDRAERARLLYVATTRARCRLHLIVQLKSDKETPPEGSLAAMVWSLLSPSFESENFDVTEDSAVEKMIQPKLRRLTKIYSPSLHLVPVQSEKTELRPEFQWASQTAIHVGTVAHHWLQRIADQKLEGWTAGRVACLESRLYSELELMGVDAENLNSATKRVTQALLGVLKDPRGRWILGDHSEAASEFSITVLGPEGLEHLRLDRTFVDEGTRWIIDFKTSQHEGGSTEDFVDSEVRRYRPQLVRYAKAVAMFDKRPIRMALYFPIFMAFCDWSIGDIDTLKV